MLLYEQVQREFRDLKAILAIQDLRVTQDRVEQLDRRAQQDLRDRLAPRDSLVLLDHREEQVPLDQRDKRETLVRQGPLGL